MSEALYLDFNRPLPVFPLENTVLFPHTLLPLHIFEPRYRVMVNDALNSHGLIAMALFRDPVSREEYLHGRPRLQPYVGLGHVEQYETLEDGRYLLLLLGLCRARMVEEVPNRPYRMARLQPFDIGQSGDRRLAPHRAELLRMVREPALDGLFASEWATDPAALPASTKALVDILTDAACDDTEERYLMLAEPDPERRATWLMEKLERLRAGKT